MIEIEKEIKRYKKKRTTKEVEELVTKINSSDSVEILREIINQQMQDK